MFLKCASILINKIKTSRTMLGTHDVVFVWRKGEKEWLSQIAKSQMEDVIELLKAHVFSLIPQIHHTDTHTHTHTVTLVFVSNLFWSLTLLLWLWLWLRLFLILVVVVATVFHLLRVARGFLWFFSLKMRMFIISIKTDCIQFEIVAATAPANKCPRFST